MYPSYIAGKAVVVTVGVSGADGATYPAVV